MSLADILKATTATIAELIRAINQDYNTKFPDLFPPNSPLANLWNTVVKVKRENGEGTDFSAEGVVDIFPFNFVKHVKNHSLVFKIKITIVDLPDLPSSS
jgi:hypothetical protein